MKNSSALKIDWCTFDAAKYACTHWHYSRCMPAGKIIKIGAWEHDKFIGCVLFSRGANNNLCKEFGLEQTSCCELTRIALNRHEAPVSRIFSIAVKMLRKNFSGLKMIVSYADPEQGHHGGIYQATNWIYLGPTKNSFSWSINGKLVHKRTADSLAKKSGLATGDFLAAKFGGAHKVQTQPKHKYIYPLTDELWATYKPKAMPYPKRANASEAGNGGVQPHSGSATLTQTLHQFGEVVNG